MGSVGLLILFAILGAFICAKTRSAAGAVVFALIALVLFCATPVGHGLPGAISSFMSAVDQASSPALGGGDQPARRRARPRRPRCPGRGRRACTTTSDLMGVALPRVRGATPRVSGR